MPLKYFETATKCMWSNNIMAHLHRLRIHMPSADDFWRQNYAVISDNSLLLYDNLGRVAAVQEDFKTLTLVTLI